MWAGESHGLHLRKENRMLGELEPVSAACYPVDER